ncbi:MAG: glycosyltransferase family 2 protein [Chthoniobacterales bacterium]
MLPGFSLVIPAYNEAQRVRETLTEVLAYLRAESPSSEVIVVDDGSSDGTAKVVREVFDAATDLATRLLCRTPNEGKGSAVRAGLLAAARN